MAVPVLMLPTCVHVPLHIQDRTVLEQVRKLSKQVIFVHYTRYKIPDALTFVILSDPIATRIISRCGSSKLIQESLTLSIG